MKWMRAILGSVCAFGCGPIEAPDGVADLAAHPEALRAEFDGGVGVRRLVLLLSPA